MSARTQRTALLERPAPHGGDPRKHFNKSMRSINPTAFQRAKFDWLFAEGCRYHVEETEDGFEVWDVKTDRIVTTKSSRIQADNFVDAMETEDDQP